MTEEIKIIEVKRIEIQPGDLIIFTLDRPIPEKDKARLTQQIEKMCPDGKVLITRAQLNLCCAIGAKSSKDKTSVVNNFAQMQAMAGND